MKWESKPIERKWVSVTLPKNVAEKYEKWLQEKNVQYEINVTNARIWYIRALITEMEKEQANALIGELS